MESLINELHPYLVEGIGLLILTIFAALGGFAVWVLNSIRSYFDARGLQTARFMLEEVIDRAKRAFPAERMGQLREGVSTELAEYLTDYAKNTSPKILAKVTKDQAAIADRMAKEAAIWVKEYREREAAPPAPVTNQGTL